MTTFETKSIDFDAGIGADQVEKEAIRNGISNADFGTSDERISGVIDDEISNSGNSWQERQEILEERSGVILKELLRRMQVMGSAYPFVINGQSIKHVPSSSGIYEFCLAAADSPTKRICGNPPASVIFEWITRDVLCAHFGPRSRGFRTGWPRVKKYEQRGARAKQTFESLHALCAPDFQWSPQQSRHPDPMPRYLKDAGLDVVVWIPWGDNRCSQFIALAQCGCGRHDASEDKARQLSIEKLSTWLSPLATSLPYRCFFLAHHIPNDSHLSELATAGGLVFDRARISMIAHIYTGQVMSQEGLSYIELAKLHLDN